MLKGKGLQQQAVVAHGVPGRLRSRIFLTFGTTRVVGLHPYAPAAFTPGRLRRPQGTLFRRWLREKSPVTDTTGNRSRYRPTSSGALTTTPPQAPY
jgi:hypothetical protein